MAYIARPNHFATTRDYEEVPRKPRVGNRQSTAFDKSFFTVKSIFPLKIGEEQKNKNDLHVARSLPSSGVEEFFMIFVKFCYLQHIRISF